MTNTTAFPTHLVEKPNNEMTLVENTSKPIVTIPGNVNSPFSKELSTIAFFNGRNDGKIGMNSSPPENAELKEAYLKGFVEGELVRSQLKEEESHWFIGWKMGYENKTNFPQNIGEETKFWKKGLSAGKNAHRIIINQKRRNKK